jgi:nitronate monooxygenase
MDSWPANALIERLGLAWPIIQAPMGIMSTPALAAAVSNAGGLGGLGLWGLSSEEAGRRVAGFRQMSGGSINVNYPLWPEPTAGADVTDPMRRHLQAHYDAKNLGQVPAPRGAAGGPSRSDAARQIKKPWAIAWHYLLSPASCAQRPP